MLEGKSSPVLSTLEYSEFSPTQNRRSVTFTPEGNGVGCAVESGGGIK